MSVFAASSPMTAMTPRAFCPSRLAQALVFRQLRALVALVAVVAFTAKDARAVYLEPQGVGQVLIYPYYTVNGGQATLLSVVNTTDQAKAVKVRFREAVKGQAVLDFNLYLAPFDMYTGALVADGPNAPAVLLSTDSSCSVPAPMVNSGASARQLHYGGPDDGPPGLERTREGSIELIEMGVLEPVGDRDKNFFYDILPINGVPPRCNRLSEAWSAGGIWSANPTAAAAGAAVGVSPPRSGLHGGAVIVDVADGIAFPYRAEALGGFYALSETKLHTPPGSAAPDLASAETSPGKAVAQIYVEGRALDLDFVAGRPDAVSAVLMGEEVINEFSIEPVLGATSEWVVTLPTRYLHLQQTSFARRRPFNGPAEDCVGFSISVLDRETGPEDPIMINDLPGHESRPAKLCSQSQVLPWGGNSIVRTGPTPLLAAQSIPDLGDDPYAQLLRASGLRVPAGQAMLTARREQFLLDGAENGGQAPRQQLFGLPVVGFWAANYINSHARPGLLANYSTAVRHRTRSRARAVIVSGEGTPQEVVTPVAER